MAKSNEGKPILDLFTQCAEDRVCEGPQDYVLRQAILLPSELHSARHCLTQYSCSGAWLGVSYKILNPLAPDQLAPRMTALQSATCSVHDMNLKP